MNRIYLAALNETWAICQQFLAWAVATNAVAIQAAVKHNQAKLPKVTGAVAVLPIHGVISQRASIWQDIFGGTATDSLQAAYTRAVNDERIKAVVLDIDSPGGTTAGVQEAAEIINRGSKLKPTVAVANSQAASAAYWLGSQVGQGNFVAAPGAEVGSIGVFRMHVDYSEAMAKEGVKASFLSVPQYKTEANPYQPLSEEAIGHHMSQVTATYDKFVAAVARGRGTSDNAVRSGYGEGRMYHADEAKERGMVDRVASIGQILGELGVGSGAHVTQAHDNHLTESLVSCWQVGVTEELREPIDLSVAKARAKILDVV